MYRHCRSSQTVETDFAANDHRKDQCADARGMISEISERQAPAALNRLVSWSMLGFAQYGLSAFLPLYCVLDSRQGSSLWGSILRGSLNEVEMQEFVTLARVEDIPNNKSMAIAHKGIEILICHADGQFHVIENRCTHQNMPLSGGRIRNGYLSCPVHGMRYKLDSGDPLGELSRIPLTRFLSRIQDGQVQVSLPE